MADFLTAVKSVRSDRPLETDFKAVKSAITKDAGDHPSADRNRVPDVDADGDTAIASPENALLILRSQPNLDQLLRVLYRLMQPGYFHDDFRLHCPGPIQAQITNSLLADIVPNFWAVINDREKAALVSCLRTVAGFNAIIARLRLLSAQRDSQNINSTQPDRTLIQLSELLFAGDDVLSGIRQGLEPSLIDSMKHDMAWKEFVNLVSYGKVVSTIAQAEDTLHSNARSWLGSASTYAVWLGRNIASLACANDRPNDVAAPAHVLARAMNFGYANSLFSGLFNFFLQIREGTPRSLHQVERIILKLPVHVKRTFTESALRWLSSTIVQPSNLEDDAKSVAAVAACLSVLARDSQIKLHLIAFLSDQSLSATISIYIRRAAIAVLADLDEADDVYNMLETLISIFCDQLFINHGPNSQQASLLQTILLLSGYLHRRKPVAFLVLGRSSNALHAVSNRLDTSNSRARWLGMTFGTAVSRLIDKEGARMNFCTDELETDETKWFLELVNIQDGIGSIDDFANLLKPSSMDTSSKKTSLPLRSSRATEESRTKPTLNGKPIYGPPRPPVQTVIIGERVSEVLDDDNDSENELKPYAKPDSDPEDSDEDATLVDRQKIRPPVYIRDLMSMLRDDQTPNRFQNGMKHAASLIRRKANFGAEVKDHAEELCSILCNLQDPFETESFEELKISALIAVLLADVTVIAPRLARQAFSGDYSLAQRCIILSALGLGGRELAGFANEDALNPSAPQSTAFPTKQLPKRLHAIYTSAASATRTLDAASADMERTIIQPIALRAADQSTAHLDAVKVRKFSSRIDVERSKRKPAPNTLAKVFGESFFFPLTNNYQQELFAYGSASIYASTPFVLVTYLKTLALLFHASGPSTLGLVQVTAEFWDLLLSLRGQAISDKTVLQAVLFAILTLLEVNSNHKQQLAQEHPKQLMETQQWVDLVFERTGGGNLIDEQKQDDEAKIRTLAAGVLVKIKEIIDAYQQQLIGYMP